MVNSEHSSTFSAVTVCGVCYQGLLCLTWSGKTAWRDFCLLAFICLQIMVLIVYACTNLYKDNSVC